MSTRARYQSGVQTFFDSVSMETVKAMSPVTFSDDFLATALDTNIWTARDSGDATETLVADAPNGVAACALAATSEAEVAALDWGDQRTLVLNQGLIFEARFRLSVLPSAAASIAAIGLCGDYNATTDTVAESIWFRADGSGAITVETDDTANETSKVATGTTLTTGDWIIGRIDCTDISDVKFYINGDRVASGTTFNMSTVPTLALQPVARIVKASGTSVGTVQVDYVRCWQNRS